MSRFEKSSHVIWHCQYHVVWVSIYRILAGALTNEVYRYIQICCGRLAFEILELNVQPDHVHLLKDRYHRFLET
jgi:putative transposase